MEKNYKYIQYTKSFDFYDKGLFKQPIIIKRWIFNWKFPFIHRMVKKYTFKSLQKELRKAQEKYVNNVLMNGTQIEYGTKTD